MVKAKDLLKLQKKRESKKKTIYQKVYAKVEKKIVLTSNTNYYLCWYSVPEFMIGTPLYRLDKCIEYIIKKLEKNGFKVTFYEPNLLQISWEEEEEEDKE